jgi:hypothetical protein
MPLGQFLLVAAIMLVALILVAVGLVVAIRGQAKRAQAHAPATEEKAAPDWVKNIAGAAGKTIARTPNAAPSLPPDAMIVMRDPASGEWLIELNGMRYHSLKDIHDDRAASKVLEALSGLQHFAGSIPLFGSPPAEQAKPAPPAALSSEKAERIPIIPVEPPRPRSQPRHPAPTNSILEEIEKILQRNLMKHPDLSDKVIHIGADSDGSLLIEVGWENYKLPDDVPDPAIRDMIKSSIQEWERTS